MLNQGCAVYTYHAVPCRAVPKKSGTRTNQFMCAGCPVTYEQALIRWISHL